MDELELLIRPQIIYQYVYVITRKSILNTVQLTFK